MANNMRGGNVTTVGATEIALFLVVVVGAAGGIILSLLRCLKFAMPPNTHTHFLRMK